jgi:S-adenosyl-L-methionine hydrolase (adenosine-forming)
MTEPSAPAPTATLPISFLTDYGLTDEFVGVVKAILAQIAPHSTVIDITHHVPAFDVRAGSLTLSRAVSYLPDGVVLAVVDPGVGTNRRAIAVAAGDMVFVGPDNGLLAPAVAMLGGATAAVELTNTDLHIESAGATFAGRDIFGPVAAYLAAGSSLFDVGTPIDPVTLVPGLMPLTRVEDDGIHAEVLWVDTYGNAQLNVDPDEIAHLGDVVSVRVGTANRTGRRTTSFGAIRTGEIGLVTDSYGLIAICMDRQSAARELGLAAGSQVVLDEADRVPSASTGSGPGAGPSGGVGPQSITIGPRPGPREAN